MEGWLEDLDRIVGGEHPRAPTQDRDVAVIQELMSPEPTDWDAFAKSFDDTVTESRQDAGIEPGYVETAIKGVARGTEQLLQGSGSRTKL